ncbi:ribokinase [Mucilaginibacter sabulilitoris]|uniref:Ribokinase n=1 Tax=Mucilaginibacter sabulilitoris TaxID=1173583 RepID=A0ABZ0TI39_9SPHI|nr:ribokinase [Mucilaginibacter sabulilitoris]WPU92454.1 ribokinase [Mucilaginibacter sabulilitoris]
MCAKILVVGSNNTDMVIKADRLPKAGETILGGTFFMNPGGKGANQAVAAARLGGQVTFISKIGNDVFGKQAVQLFKDGGIDTSFIFSDPDNPSGVALITVDNAAENCIVVASGANATLLPKDLQEAKTEIENAGVVLMQLEIPLETVEYVTAIASSCNVPIILNPAPICALSDKLLKNLYIITPNSVEASMLTGIKVIDQESAKLAAIAIHKKGVKIVIITLGAEGALIFNNGEFIMVAAEKVKPVDTTAAGDVFNGALAIAVAEGKGIETAVRFACKAAGIAVTRLGAQSSAPYKREMGIF